MDHYKSSLVMRSLNFQFVINFSTSEIVIESQFSNSNVKVQTASLIFVAANFSLK